MKLTFLVALSLMVTLAGMTGCQTTMAPIPVDATSDIYFQRAQGASDLDQFKESLSIYELFLKRHPQPNPVDLYSARYEIALLHKKLGELALSLQEFQGILDDYNDPVKSAGAPGWVRNLSDKLVVELKAKLPPPAADKPQA